MEIETKKENSEKTGDNSLLSPVNSVYLRTQKEEKPREFMGYKLLKGNELWDWKTLEDVNFK